MCTSADAVQQLQKTSIILSVFGYRDLTALVSDGSAVAVATREALAQGDYAQASEVLNDRGYVAPLHAILQFRRPM
jgi:hypothetical protein